MPVSDHELLEAAGRLAEAAGRPRPVAIERLPGGHNNLVFRVALACGPPLFLKRYFSDPRDTRQRLASEWSFLTLAWSRGIRVIPEPLAADQAANLGLYSFVQGCPLRPGEVGRQHIEAAADFVVALNALPPASEALPPASEACFSLAQHMATIDRRVDQLGAIGPDVPHRSDLDRFVLARLKPMWSQVRGRVASEAERLGINLQSELIAAERIVSPSDLGFHNVLLDGEGRAIFTDFEYAGCDDPAKLVCDFFCQPQVPAPLDRFDAFVASLSERLTLGDKFALRCRVLLDAYRVKWTCIILNDFRAVGAAQRAFARDEPWADRCAAQLTKAEAKIAEVSQSQGVV